MVSSLDRDVRKFKQQSELLLLTIQAAQKREKWEKNTVIMDKGKLVFPGGGWKPDPAPAFRILSDEEMYALKQGKLQTIADVDRFRKNPDITTGEGKTLTPKAVTEGDKASNLDSAIASAKASLKSAQDSIIAAFDNLKTVTATKFTEIWSDPKVLAVRKQISDALGEMGGKAKQVYNDTMKFFSDAVANFNKSESGKDYVGQRRKRGVGGVLSDVKKAIGDAGKGFAESDTGKDIANAKKATSEFASAMKKNVNDMMKNAMGTITDAASGGAQIQAMAGVNAAVAAISGFLYSMANKANSAEVSGEFATKAKSNIVKMLRDLAMKFDIPSDVMKKMEASIKDIDFPAEGKVTDASRKAIKDIDSNYKGSGTKTDAPTN